MNDTPPRSPILLDALAGLDTDFDTSFLERNGHDVILCHGPQGARCPLLAERACDKYEAAHGVVFKLDLDDAQHRAIVTRYRASNPGLPIRVIASPGQAARYPLLAALVQIWEHEPTVVELDGFAALVDAVDNDADGERIAQVQVRHAE